MTKSYALSDAQWVQIEHLLPGQAGQPGATAKNNRLFVDAVLYRYRAGIPWRDLPERCGDFRIVHTRHSRWSKKRHVACASWRHWRRLRTTNTP